jgi:winged helix-turn helix protein
VVEVTERPRRKRLSWESRCEIVARIESGMSPPLAAASGGASRATGYRLWRRYQQGGWAGLRDRPSIPVRQPRRLSVSAEEAILAARRRSAYGPVRLAGLVPHPPSTIGKVLRRHGCSRLPRPDNGARCARRYEREQPGELLHIDTKKLGRFWEPGKRVLSNGSRSAPQEPACWLAASARCHRRSLAACLRRTPPRPGRRHLRALPRTRSPLVPRARRRRRTRPHRQREGLPLTRMARGL